MPDAGDPGKEGFGRNTGGRNSHGDRNNDIAVQNLSKLAVQKQYGFVSQEAEENLYEVRMTAALKRQCSRRNSRRRNRCLLRERQGVRIIMLFFG